MRALVFQNNSLRFERNYPTPVPGPGEALVRVNLAGICATDLEIIKGYMGFEGVLGHEFVGVVEQSSGNELTGRRVAGEINIRCDACDYCRSGLGRHCPNRSVLGIAGRDGAFAEYVALPVENLHPLPDSVTDRDAVFVEPLAAAFEIVEQVRAGTGDHVCILGDGRLGQLAAQVLSLHTANLLVIGRHEEKLAILRERGIKTELAARGGKAAADEKAGGDVQGETGGTGVKFDVVVDCTGASSGLASALSLVRPRGTIVLKTTIAGERAVDLNQVVIDEITLVGSRCGPYPPAIAALAQKKIDTSALVTRVFPLDEGPAALRYAGQEGVLKVLLEI